MSASMRHSQALLDGVESQDTLQKLMEQMRLQKEAEQQKIDQESDMKFNTHEARDRAKMIRAIINQSGGAISEGERQQMDLPSVEVPASAKEIDKMNSDSDPMFKKYMDMLNNKE